VRRTSKLLLFLAMIFACGAITLAPTRAWADDAEAKAKAQTLFERGITAYKDGRFKDAIDSFLDAHRVYPSPTLSFNAARAYEKMGDNSGALRFYREYLRQSPTATDKARVVERVADLEKKLEARGVQQVTVLSNVVGATVVLDGKPVGVTPWTGEIAPGKHDVKLRQDGYKEAKGEFDLTAQHALDFQLDMEVGSSAAPVGVGDTNKEGDTTKPDRDTGTTKKGISPWTFVAFGVGVAALGGAVVFEQLRKSSEDDVKTEETQLARHQAYDAMKNRQTAARVLTGVGAAGILVGGVLLYFDLSSGGGEKKSARAVGVGCDTYSCAATFAGRF
jgi:tetratricopeptide (TPR) repeat protein